MKPKKGCGKWYGKKIEDKVSEPAKCGLHGLCPECSNSDMNEDGTSK